MPQVDITRLIDSYRKNLDSMNQAVHLASETLSTLGQLQAKYFNETLSELGEVMETMKGGQPQDKFIRAGVAVKDSMMKAYEHSTQLGKVLSKAGKQASSIVMDFDKKPK